MIALVKFILFAALVIFFVFLLQFFSILIEVIKWLKNWRDW